jgi:hypothetical protein
MHENIQKAEGTSNNGVIYFEDQDVEDDEEYYEEDALEYEEILQVNNNLKTP